MVDELVRAAVIDRSWKIDHELVRFLWQRSEIKGGEGALNMMAEQCEKVELTLHINGRVMGNVTK
jgi:hypothetical protein